MSSQGRILKDKIAHKVMLAFVWLTIILLLVIALGLFIKAWPLFKTVSISDLLFSTTWVPYEGKFGMLSFIISTFWVTGVATVIAVPLCLLCAIYLSEYANKKVIAWVSPLIDILAGIPSVIFGIWGVIVIVPFVRDILAPMFGVSSTGYSILAGGIVLSIMVFPIVIYVLLEVFKTVPEDLRNAALSLGANKWIMIRKVLLRKAGPGIISAIVLGFSRALGETLAVLMVVGNVVDLPSNPLEAGYPLPAMIANNYGELLSIPMYDSALMLCALVLFVIVVFFNIIARIILRRIEKKIS
ncbi:MAG: phosphate ABC transporter permease subunit PstC [Cytophagaceae bacterium]|nr:phosphate ABC transporter permease subunit PstC [Cytophagaceae bacterium]